MTEAIPSTFIRLFYICSNKNGKSSKINKKRLNAELLRGERRRLEISRLRFVVFIPLFSQRACEICNGKKF
jgi:hypothetical protein